jgi:SAM-dependent methyltransferase
MNINSRVATILRDPVTLGPVVPGEVVSGSGGYLELRSGGLSRKNEQEIEHFRRTFSPMDPVERLYMNRITALPKPLTTEETIVVDIGCGPYDCISAMPGTHVFVDDIMNLYVDEIGARLDGTPVCARTELMPFADDCVDLLYSVNMLDHVDDMPATIAEMHRVLSPDGRIYCQSYFNSHPLLDAEPGVFDRAFYDDYVLPLFEIEHVQTYAVGDPAISQSYNMDIIGMVLKKRVGVEVETKPRDRYEDDSYRGPQSNISVALGALGSGDLEVAKTNIDALASEPFYEAQHLMLTAQYAIASDDLGAANDLLKALRSHERVKKNPHAQLTVNRLQNLRITTANRKIRATNKALRDANKRLREEAPATAAPSFSTGIQTTLRRVVALVSRRGRS